MCHRKFIAFGNVNEEDFNQPQIQITILFDKKKEIREKEVQTDCLAYLEMRARSDQKVIQENQVWSIVFCFDFFQRISCLYTSHI